MLAPLVVLSYLTVRGLARNEWSTPCHDGTCSYDVGPSNGTTSGTITLRGSKHAISDITPASGWLIMNCSATASTHDVRLVCANETAGCSHLYQNGAEGTLVRLPEDCGSGPFALVSKAWTHEDQSLPVSSATKLTRRDGSTPEVKGLSLHTNWTAANSSHHGNVSFTVQGASFPGQNNTITTPPSGPNRRSRLNSHFTSFNKTTSGSAPPIQINENFPEFTASVSCPGSDGAPTESLSIDADMDTKTDLSVNYGVTIAGTVIPPKITDFGLYVDVDGDFDGTLNLKAAAKGTIDSGRVTLFQQGLPGLSFAGILDVGPEFKLNGEIKAQVDLDVDLNIGLDYSVQNAQLYFPASAGHTSGGDFAPKDSSLQLSVSRSVETDGTIEGHLIPTIDFGLNAFDGVVKADVFLDLDAFVSLGLNLTASANETISTGSNSTNATMSMSDGGAVDGCVDVQGGLSVDAGAEGSFFDLFDDTTKVSLFSKKFDLFQKCFGDSNATATTKRDLVPRLESRAGLSSRQNPVLTCLDPALGKAEQIVNKVLSATGFSEI